MRAIGIDLGTTNSAAAIAGKEVKVLPTGDNERLTPSVVSFVKKRKSQQGEIVVGRAAVNNARRDPENTVFSVKRLMGRFYGEDEVEDVRRRAGFKIADPPADDAEDQSVKVLLGGEPYSAVEISAMILRQVRKDAEQALGEPVTHAVITVPAYFQDRQRSATSEAGRQAGLEVLKIIDEPTAAAIAYGVGKEEEKHRVLVYDLGGGTFDISIIQMVGGQFQILEILGDTWLGGDDFDLSIVSRMIEWVKEECDGFDPSEDKSFLAKAKEEAQKVKIALSRQESVEIFEPLLRLPGEGVVDVDMEFTREQFEKDIEPLVDKTIDLVNQALANQNLTPDDITEVILVGGSTAIPKVQAAVAGVFGKKTVKRHVEPMECVALGAAILADKYELKDDGTAAGERVERDLVEPTAMHLGIAAVRNNNLDAFVPIIPKGTPYPLSEPKRRIFYPTEDGQRLIKVPVYEGLNELASLNEQQGTIEFPLPEGIDSNSPVEVSFNYDRNRILTVAIRVVGTDHFIEEELRRDQGRSQARREPESLMDDWREDLQPTLRAANHFLNSYGAYMDDDDRAELQSALRDGDRAVKEDREIDGKRATATLQHKIMGSGSASLLFMAERVIQGAPEQIARKLAVTVAQLREAHERSDGSKAEELGAKLRVLVAQVMAERSKIEGVEDRKSLEHLLQVRD